MSMPPPPGPPIHPVTIELDGEPLDVPDRDTTPDAVLALAGLSPATHYLVRVNGRHRESLQGKGAEPVRLHEREKFVSLSTQPTPTS